MSSIIGSRFRVSIFGESHGRGIGCVIEGIPAGLVLDEDLIKKRLRQRKPGKDQYSTPRNEKDAYDIMSGFFMGKTTGTPLMALFKNTDTRSKDYSKSKDFWRPGHADFTGESKYKGANDFRGGGHFSARITAPVVFAGAIAEQLLAEKGVEITGQVFKVGNQEAESFEHLALTPEVKLALDGESYAILPDYRTSFLETVDQARNNLDSVGGVVECVVTGMPVGIGEPFYDSIESKLAHGMFSIPAMKGISFGKGFDFAAMHGSEANDTFECEEGRVVTRSNHNAGINGGISNGMPIWFKCVFKPTASIARQQTTYNKVSQKVENLEIVGRHDPCVALRAVPIVKAMTALALYDLFLEDKR